MDLQKIWTTQRKLRRKQQIHALVRAIKQGQGLPKVILHCCEDDEVQVGDGHHRLVAYWLSGRRTLAKHEYLLIFTQQGRPRCGRIRDLACLVTKRR